MSDETNAGSPDFVELYRRFTTLDPGHQAALRRAVEPGDTADTPALYRLFPGQRPTKQHQRVVYLLPWVPHAPGARDFARQLLDAKVSEARVIQVARANWPLDLVQFRRLAIHAKPRADWARLGQLLWFWNAENKRRLVEDFYLAKFTPKGGKP